MKYILDNINPIQKINQKNGYIFNKSYLNEIELRDSYSNEGIPIFPRERLNFSIKANEELFIASTNKDKNIEVIIISASYSPEITHTIRLKKQNSSPMLIKEQQTSVR